MDTLGETIRGVKLIGFESKNQRIYGPAVLKAAVHLYEGAKVNIDHPEGGDPSRTRTYSDRFGVIRGARFVEGQGIFADFHYNPKHHLAEQFVWDAENNPSSLGFSHNAIRESREAFKLDREPGTTDLKTYDKWFEKASDAERKAVIGVAWYNDVLHLLGDERLPVRNSSRNTHPLNRSWRLLMKWSTLAITCD